MRRGFFSRMNPTLRGFLIIAAIAGVVVVLQLQATVVALLIARADRLHPRDRVLRLPHLARAPRRRSRPGRAARASSSTARRSSRSPTSASTGTAARTALQILAFVGVLALCGVAMWRTWRDQHTYYV